jgi:Type IV secretion system pilin
MRHFLKTVYLSVSTIGLFLLVFLTEAKAQLDGAVTNEVTEVTLENPLNNITSIEGLLVALLNIFIVLMIPVIVFFIILSGFKYVTAQGNSSKIEEATRSLTYAIVGGVLILGAVAIAEIIKNTVQAF